MSQENVEQLARRWADAFNAFMRDELSSEAYAEHLDPQIEVRWHDRRIYPDAPQRVRVSRRSWSSLSATGAPGTSWTWRCSSSSTRRAIASWFSSAKVAEVGKAASRS
jgi:hypothetical protein